MALGDADILDRKRTRGGKARIDGGKGSSEEKCVEEQKSKSFAAQ